MAERTFYDILEVSDTASSETIQAAYERLAAKFDPAKTGNADNAAARLQYDAIRQAYLTLANADSRAQYDRKLHLRTFTAPRLATVVDSFWTLPKMIITGVIVLAIAGFYFKHEREQARIDAERAVAVAKAREAEEKTRAEAETERLAMQRESERERAERMEAARARRERDADINRVQRDVSNSEYNNRTYSSSNRTQVQNDEYRKRAEEAQAAAAARQQLARDRAELCRIERERYGRSLSC